MDWFSLGVQKYWAPTSSISPATRRMKLEQAAASGNYLYSRKYDGNFCRAVITKERNALQTRGISKVTGTYSELQEKVFFWDSVVNAFQNGDTVILGELYLPGGVDKDVGSISRCLVQKARERQKVTKLEWRIFDVLALDGENLMNKGIEIRSTYIKEVVKRINNPLVKGIEYHEMTPSFFEEIAEIFADNGEGAVCYRKGIPYTPDKRTSAWDTIKVKQEISDDIDCVIIGLVPCERNYNGGDIGHWELWENTRTKQLVCGEYFSAYQNGEPYEPVSRNYFNGFCGAIQVGVYDNKGQLIPLCNVAGLTDDFKIKLRDNFEDWYLCPISIGGMMISSSTDGSISVRHPHLKVIRKDDIDAKDCTLEKILS